MNRFVCALFVLVTCFAALAEDGKIYVKSEPAGAEILQQIGEGDKAEMKKLDKRTPSLIEIPKGKATLMLKLDGYKVSILKVEVKDGITKPDVVKMDKETVNIDVIFVEEGWNVFVDKKPALDKDNKPATTPCTIQIDLGKHEIALAKEGFKDIVQKIDADRAVNSIELKDSPVKGVGSLKTKPVPIATKEAIEEKTIKINESDKDGIVLGGDKANITKDFCIEFWVLTKSSEGTLITKRHVDGDGSITLELKAGLIGLVGDAPASRNDGVSKTKINDGAWHHVAVSKSGIATTLYIDGKKQVRINTRESFSSSSPWKLGCHGCWQTKLPTAEFFRVRISSTDRYPDQFNPSKTYEEDKDTVFFK